jgi:hypothetical protein
MGRKDLQPKDWIDYPGYYEKNEYDIITEDGTTIIGCYPNGGIFTCIQEGKHANKEVPADKVRKIRYTDPEISYINL